MPARLCAGGPERTGRSMVKSGAAAATAAGGGEGFAPPTDLLLSALLPALLRLQLQRRRFHAVAGTGRLRAVRENVAEVGVAARAQDLGAAHEEAAIVLGRHRVVADWRPEGGPAGAALVLGLAREQRLAAADAGVGARSLRVPVAPC